MPAVVGLLAGIVVGPLADRLATNAPLHDPLLRSRAAIVRASGWSQRERRFWERRVVSTFGFTLEALVALIFCWVLVVITRTDFEHRLIPDKIVLPGAVVVLALRTIDDPSRRVDPGALGAGLVLFLIVLVYPRGLGMGDVKLSAFLGAGLGVSVIVAMFVGFFVAFVPAVVLFVRHGKEARKQAIPLGPFLALGGVIALFWGGRDPRLVPGARRAVGNGPREAPAATPGEPIFGRWSLPLRLRVSCGRSMPDC